jgi:hypothetical protein
MLDTIPRREEIRPTSARPADAQGPHAELLESHVCLGRQGRIRSGDSAERRCPLTSLQCGSFLSTAPHEAERLQVRVTGPSPQPTLNVVDIFRRPQ